MGGNPFGLLGDGTTTTRNQAAPITVLLSATPPALTIAGVDETVALAAFTLGTQASHQWYVGESGDTSAPVTGATQRFLDVPPGPDTVRVWLRIFNPWHSADTGTLTVQPSQRPSIRTRSWQPAADSSGVATLRVDARGQDLNYQWYEGVSGDLSAPVVGATSATFVTPALTASTRYWVRITNVHGHIDSASIRVRLPERSAIAGGNHTLLLQPDRSAWAWGYNLYGQLARGGTSGGGAVPAPTLPDTVAVAAGQNHTLFLLADGSVWAAGRNADGQLGDGTTTAQLVPVPVVTEARAIAIAAGTRHSLLLTADGTVHAWGRNSAGQLGNGATTDVLAPAAVFTGVVAIAAGDAHSVFLRADASAWACGSNTHGQLGDRTTTSRLTPAFIGTGIEAVGAGHNHTLLLQADGTALACGLNTSGQRGVGSTAAEPTPRVVLTDVRSFTAGERHSLWVKTDDSVWASGLNINSQLGDGTTTQRTTPLRIDAHVVSQTVSATVRSGQRQLLQLTTTAANLSHQWFRGPSGDLSQPIPGALSSTYFAPSLEQTTAFWVRIDNGWSFADSETLVVTFDPRPNLVSQSPGARVLPGQNASLTVQAFGPDLAYQWYAGEPGDLSQPVPGATSATFVTSGVVDGARYWVRVGNPHGHSDGYVSELHVGRPLHASAALNHSLFLKPDGTAWAVGANNSGQLGTGNTTRQNNPVQILPEIRALSATNSQFSPHSLFLKLDGTVLAAGNNSSGQLGLGDTTARSTPAALNLFGVRALASAERQSLFLLDDHSLWATGTNSSGQFGTGVIFTVQSTSLQIGNQIAAFAPGPRHGFFMPRDGGVFAAGSNLSGQLGDGTTLSRPSSVSLRPVITSPLARLTDHSDLARLQITATPAPTLSYLWYRGAIGDTTLLVSSIGASGLSPADLDAPASFWVRITNWLGQVDSEAVVVQPRYTVWSAARAWPDTGADAANADPDSDGLVNFLEYALGADPLAPTATAWPVVATSVVADEPRLSLSFRRISDPDLLYEVLASDDLGAWQPIWSSTGAANTPGPVTVTDETDLSDQPSRFLRLRVTR